MTTGPGGIYATLGFAPEATPGTFVAPTHFTTIISEGGEGEKTTETSKTLHGGIADLASRRALTKWGAKMTWSLDMYDRGLGLFWANAIGASTVTNDTGYYTQVFTPSDTTGKALSIQVGRPTSTGSMQAVSYECCKVTDWSIGAKAGSLATFSASFDAMKEDTSQSYTAPSYTTSNLLTALETTLTVGGTASTTSGVTSISGGSVAAAVRDSSVKVTNALDTNRYFLGSAYKAEQLINGPRQMKGNVSADFGGISTFYSTFAADTSFALQFDVTGPIINGSTHSAVQVLFPCCFWDTDVFSAKGPELIEESLSFTAYDDDVNNFCQVTLVTLDSAI